MQLQFNQTEHFNEWKISNDGVMGGLSQSRQTVTDKGVIYQGEVSLANNGGFASIEYLLTQKLNNTPPLSSITLIVTGDGNRYQLRLKTPWLNYGEAYIAEFDTQAGIETQHDFTINDFRVGFRGRDVYNAPKLNINQVDRIGILIANKQQGDFTILLQSITLNE
ncbi:CIA30 family protein [Shewanella aestuarii]|uniref:CIA30 family protein n=1 Tax=Shewanella aestuarii TaxID=1028752 RepID=A0A6G9QLV0_9GAMM|nr:CIA30 family protein [Shewanella aestuarii]QIR15564.1 CIA30 family protein [Shewanella aestuarii]